MQQISFLVQLFLNQYQKVSVVIQLQFSSSKKDFFLLNRFLKCTEYKDKNLNLHQRDVNYVCTKTVPDSTKLLVISMEACPRTPLVRAIYSMHVDRYLPLHPHLAKSWKKPCSGSPHDNEASGLYWNTMNCELHNWHLHVPHKTTSNFHLDAFSPGRMGEEN